MLLFFFVLLMYFITSFTANTGVIIIRFKRYKIPSQFGKIQADATESTNAQLLTLKTGANSQFDGSHKIVSTATTSPLRYNFAAPNS